MFTGLIQDIGKVQSISLNKEGKVFTVQTRKLAPEIKIDDSVSVNGACQTAISLTEDSFTVQAVHSTLEKTTLNYLKVGEEVNLELALTLSQRLGGHLVQGHINEVGSIESIEKTGRTYLLRLSFGSHLRPYFIDEGSITIDGISLTIQKCGPNHVLLAIIPHTWESTILRNKKVGDKVNIEVDMIAKYVENFLKYSPKKEITLSYLNEKGFK